MGGVAGLAVARLGEPFDRTFPAPDHRPGRLDQLARLGLPWVFARDSQWKLRHGRQL